MIKSCAEYVIVFCTEYVIDVSAEYKIDFLYWIYAENVCRMYNRTLFWLKNNVIILLYLKNRTRFKSQIFYKFLRNI